MSRVLALVEGQTETQFVKGLLGPHLANKGVYLTARMVGKVGRRGGARRWPVTRRDIVATLKEDPEQYCTTMFDYYGLPTDWPGVAEVKRKPFREGAALLEEHVRDAICDQLGQSFNSQRFIPYIQLHEFEALLFSDPAILADVIQPPELEAILSRILKECGEPERIDDDPNTAPSKRIKNAASRYEKVLHGSIAARRIGLLKMRQACPHFSQWVQRLEKLGASVGLENGV